MERTTIKIQIWLQSTVDGVDMGRLFVALNNLRSFNSSLAPRLNDIVLNKGPYHNRSDYSVLVPAIKAESLMLVYL